MEWLLETGFFRDDGVWVDYPAVWHDYPLQTGWIDYPDPEGEWTSTD